MMRYERIDPQRKMVVGVGSALIDILAHEDDAFLSRTGAIKGGMSYVDKNFIDYTVGLATLTPQIVPGGSACNTMVGIGRLGGQARFVGKCGNGPMGRLFKTDLHKQNVEPMLFGSDTPTGRVLSIITPDAQRSMFTFLGASAEAQPHEITQACFEKAAVAHVEGYLLFNRDLITAVLASAKAAGALVSLDLASFNVVQECRDILPELISRYVDILIANEDEAHAYSGSRDEHKALRALAAHVDIAVLKLGERGSLIACGNETVRIGTMGNGAQAIDTTGAGDLWAAGFLYGLINHMPIARCGELGALCGFEVCQVVGAHIPDERWDSIKRTLEEEWPPNALIASSC